MSLFWHSCQRHPATNNAIEIEFDENLVILGITKVCTEIDTAFIGNYKMTFADTLIELYKYRGYKPFFIEEEGFASPGTLLEYLKHSSRHGINPERYNIKILSSIADSILDTSKHTLDYEQIAKLDFLLSDSYLRYNSDILYGIVNPTELDSENYSIPLPKRKWDPIGNLLDSDRLELLEEIQPVNPAYVLLQKELDSLVSRQDSIRPVKITFNEKKLEAGKHSGSLPSIVHNLRELGFLDSLYIPDPGNHYDSLLFQIVKRFQSRYGLADDGVIGKNTIDQLNISPSERIEIIKINLERMRWTTYSDSQRYILVNIPDFHVYGIENGEVKTKIKVCVGQKRERYYEERKKLYKKTNNWHHRPKNFETPQVYSRIDMIITNPPWVVPTSIAKNETYYEIMKDSTYLKRLGFKVFKGNEQIDHSTVNWNEYSPNNLPFNFVQDPGGANALGRLKFMFNNKYAIYLHDTPTRPPFATLPRAVSHGCVRVEKPLQLAEFILNGDEKLQIDDIKVEIGVKPEDKELLDKYYANSRKKAATKMNYLSSPIPVFVDYLTAWVDQKGELQFRPDVYEKDHILLKALKEKGAI